MFVLDPYVFLLLIPGQQLFPRASKVLVGVQNRDKGADCQVTLNDQITADGKEEEGGKLIDKVVEKFDKKFAPINLVTDVVKRGQPISEARKFQFRRVVSVNFVDAGNCFAEMIG